MMGAALSRWTMASFAAALAFLVGAQALMVAGYGFPAADIRAPQTLVVVHMVTIGWLSLLLCGALFQFVPVLVAKPLLHERLVLPSLLLLLAGLVSLLCGFLHLSDRAGIAVMLLALAGVLLPAGFALALFVLGATLWSARPLPLPARFVAVGLACVAATAAFGSLFSLALAGFVARPALLDLHAAGVPVHAAAGFGGWLTFTAVGVSYRLLPMFMLSPDHERATGRVVLYTGGAALALAVVAAPAEALLAGTAVAFHVAGALALVALAAYAADLSHFYRMRKRRVIELNSKSALGAFAGLYLSAVLLLALWATGTISAHAGALVYLVAFGWLTGLGLSQLYKIVPFLTWLECYGPVMGRKPTPRVQDLVVERRDSAWFALYFLGVAAGAGALLAGAPGLFRLASAVTLSATAAIVVELVLVRRLVNVKAALRLPEGTSRPRLFLPPRTETATIGAAR
ncbi:MAG: hypothetical protein DCC69_14150 [Hyphomicrobiales bacterium]|nr:MAG: hypothetical protein DCC69_14150 [Hyphomicrobiales bacterium]